MRRRSEGDDDEKLRYLINASNYIDSQVVAAFAGDFQITARLSFDAYGSYQAIISNSNDGAGNGGFLWEIGSARPPCVVRNNTVYSLANTVWNPTNEQGFTPDTVYKLDLIRTSGVWLMYVNDTVFGAGFSLSGTISTTNPFLHGVYAKNAPNIFRLFGKTHFLQILDSSSKILDYQGNKHFNWDTITEGYYPLNNESGIDGRVYTNNINTFYL